MENTLENKSKFFAQYWLQEVKTSDKHKSKGLKPLSVNPHSIQYLDDFSYLELTPLSQISDEDANILMIMENFIEMNIIEDSFLEFLIGLKSGITHKIETVDYLRSKGYALPYMSLSVEKQIEYGWIKLKTNN